MVSTSTGITLNPKQVEAGEAEPKVILAFDVSGIKDLAMEESFDALAQTSRSRR